MRFCKTIFLPRAVCEENSISVLAVAAATAADEKVAVTGARTVHHLLHTNPSPKYGISSRHKNLKTPFGSFARRPNLKFFVIGLVASFFLTYLLA